jgi:hypothetical protein
VASPAAASLAVAQLEQPLETDVAITQRPISNKEDAIFSEDSDDDNDDGDDDDARKEKEALPSLTKGHYFGQKSAESKSLDPLGMVLGISTQKVEAAAQALAAQKDRDRKRQADQLELNKTAAERESAAQGAYGSYFQRTVGATVTESLKAEEDEEERSKRARFVVEEDDEVDDETMLNQFRSTLDVGALEVKKEPRKKRAKGHEKMKANQAMEKIEKIMEEKEKQNNE